MVMAMWLLLGNHKVFFALSSMTNKICAETGLSVKDMLMYNYCCSDVTRGSPLVGGV